MGIFIGRTPSSIKEDRMRKLALFVLALFCAGCTTVTQYHKKVTVEKGQDGKIIKTIVEEEITQPYLQKEASDYKYMHE